MILNCKATLQPARNPRRNRFSCALLNTVAASAIAAVGLGTGIVQAQVVPGAPQCNVAGTTVTCTGDLSTGVDITSPSGITVYDTLNVNNADPVGGISFTANAGQDITITADTTGTAGISTTGADEDGILARVIAGDGNIAVSSTGDIFTIGDGAEGIFARQAGDNGNVTVSSNGNITTAGESADGISAGIAGNGDITVTSTGDILATGPQTLGIFATIGSNDAPGDGNIWVNNTGDISVDFDSISATIRGAGSLTVHSDGNLNGGIFSRVDGAGNVTVISDGNIINDGYGINAQLTANQNFGLDGSGNVFIQSTGDITATSEGINTTAQGTGNVTVISDGNITARIGIDAGANNGDTLVVSTGNITAEREGIEASTGSGSVTVQSSGNITVEDGQGIDTRIAGGTGNITIISEGAITAEDEAIRALHEGTGTIDITVAGSVTGSTAILTPGGEYNSRTAAATINSSATIRGTGGFAIDLRDDANDTVNLNGGSAIFGAIDFGNGNDGAGGSNPNDIDTLNVGPGVNAVLTFADNSGTDDDLQSAPENITGNVVLLEDGTTAVAVDATGFATAQTWLNSITTSIFNAIDGIWQAGDEAGEQQSAGFSLSGDGTQFTPVAYTNAAGTGHRFWGSAFGGGRDQEGSGTTVNVDHVFAGLILGVEGIQARDFRAGVFAGGGHSQFDVQFDAQTTEVTSGFGGIYARQDWETHWLRAVVTGGFANHDSERRVANANIGGFETASADYDGYFIAPALTAGARLGELVPDHALWGSIRVHYAGMFLDGYTEGGVDAPLTVDDRDIHILGGRAQLAAPYEQLGADGAVFRFEGRIGVDAQFNIGGSDVETTVAGLPLNFTATFDDEIVSGFVGGSLARTSEDGSSLFKASTEVHLASDGSYELRGSLNAVWNF